MKCAMLVVSEVLTTHLPSWLTAHALGLDADRDLGCDRAAGDVDHRHHVVVLVGDVELAAVRRDAHLLGVRPGRQRADDLAAGGVQDLDRVVVRRADVEELAVLAERRCRAAGCRPGPRLTSSSLSPSTMRDRVALLVGHVDARAPRRAGRTPGRRQPASGRAACAASRASFSAGCSHRGSLQPALRSRARRSPGCRAACAGAGTAPAARPRPACAAHEQDRLAHLLVPVAEGQPLRP